MSIALSMARRHIGRTGGNPSVGCVLTADIDGQTQVIGRGVTAIGGRPHAETEALANAVAPVAGCTAYVTLEPCSHQGKTGPCCDALIDAKVGRVVIALEDPNPKVSGQGIRKLIDAGIAVDVGVLTQEARETTAAFLTRMEKARPMVTLKVATSLDGRIAAHTGASQWITNELARRRAHLLRATHDAIMVGSNTALMDDPLLTCRIDGLEHHSPIRVVADGRLRLPLTSKMVRSAGDRATIILTLKGGDRTRQRAYSDCGITVVEVSPGADGRMDMISALDSLAERDVNSVLVEGGAHLASSLLQNELVDRLVWFRAPSIIGGDGTGAVAPLGVDRPDAAPNFHLIESRRLGDNVMETYAYEI